MNRIINLMCCSTSEIEARTISEEEDNDQKLMQENQQVRPFPSVTKRMHGTDKLA